MKKRVLTFVLFVCMLVSLIPAAGVYAFSDVTTETQYGAAILALEDWGKIEGYSDGTYKPEELITRAEFVKMLVSVQSNNGLEYIPDGVQTGFEDVDSQNHWASRYIKLAVDKKVIRGYEDGSFRPENNVTYEEALKMVTCLLGYELSAQWRADALGMELWPDGYIAIANELTITKGVSVESFSSVVTRGAVAQVIYNASSVPEVNPVTQQPISMTPAGTGTSSGPNRPGGGGGGGGGRPGNSIGSDSLVKNGILVATNNIFIDDTAYFENNGRISSAYIILKEDNTGNYIKFATNYKASESGYTSQIGHHVRVTYQEVDDTAVDYKAMDVRTRDTITISVSAEDIYKVEDNVFQYDEMSSGRWTRKKIKYDIPNMKFMYNGKIVRNEDGTTDNLGELISEADLKPEVGNVELVDTDNNGVADYAIIDSYTTIVVGECKTESVQENPDNANSKYKRFTVKDKFATVGEGEEKTPKTYVFDDRQLVNEKGEEVNNLSLSAWNVVYLAQPKDESQTIIRVSSSTQTSRPEITVREIDVNGETITAATTGSNDTTYTTSQYFRDYVWDTIKEEAMESGIKLLLYLEPNGKVAAAQVKEPSYQIGYLINAAMDTQSNDLLLRIVTSGNKLKADTQQFAISNTAKIDGKLVKKDEILQMLKDNAAQIREGKPEHMMINAEMAQPIRFEINGTSKNSKLSLIRNLDIVEANEQYLFQENGTDGHGAKRYLEPGNSTKGFGRDINSVDFDVQSTTMVILLPNNRYETKYYQIFAMNNSSSVKQYLKANETYNVEPYLIPKTDGTGEENGIVVLYYEDSCATATVSSPVAIVKEIKDALDSESQPVKKIETVSASTSAGTSASMTYTATEDELRAAKYYGAAEGAPTHEVKVGDVITFGKTMDNNNIRNIQILFDVSERNNVNQQKHLQLKESGNIHTDDESLAPYRVVLGKITFVPDGSTADTRARIYVDDDSIQDESKREITVNVSNKTVYGYDPDDRDSKPSSQDEDKKTLKFMEYAQVGDYVFIFQAESNERYIYVVKNRTIISGQPEDGSSETGSKDGNEQGENGEQTRNLEENKTDETLLEKNQLSLENEKEDGILPSEESEESEEGKQEENGDDTKEPEQQEVEPEDTAPDETNDGVENEV